VAHRSSPAANWQEVADGLGSLLSVGKRVVKDLSCEFEICNSVMTAVLGQEQVNKAVCCKA
jgi:hypothetical protein